MSAAPEQEIVGPEAPPEARQPGTKVARPTSAGKSPVAIGDNSPEALMRLAIEKAGTSAEAVSVLKELVALKNAQEDRVAAHEFFDALAAFQSECPPVRKNRTAKFATRSGSEMEYNYAELDVIAAHIAPYLHKHGLSYSWDTKVEGNQMTVTCFARHRAGHVVTSSTVLPVENPSAMSAQQKVGAAMTFGQRKTLCQAFGITTAETDTDARGEAVDPTPVSKEQADELMRAVGAGGVSIQKFLAALKITSIVELPKVRFEEAKLMIAQAVQARQEREAKKP